MNDAKNDRDLFGREVIYSLRGEQLPLFHEPVTLPTPKGDAIEERIKRQCQGIVSGQLFTSERAEADKRQPGLSERCGPADAPEASPDESNEAEESEESEQFGESEESDEHRPLRGRIEEDLRRRDIPYVNVIEAKRALFGAAHLDCFHFVVYAPVGDNWLLLVAEAGEANRQTMSQWQDIFGDGFKAVFAVERAAGIVFKTLSGEKLDLSELQGKRT